MKIIKLIAENVKKLRAVEIRPTGNIVQITGPNGSGKSSVLDSIYYALAGTKDIPSQPVRRGTKKAIVRLDLGEVTVTRRFTEGGGTTLTIEAANGARFPSPQKMLDDLMGQLAFDPLAFTRMDARQQLEALRKMVPVAVDIEGLDAANALDFAARTEVNRNVKALQAQIDATRLADGAPAAEQDISALLQEMKRAADENNQLVQRVQNRKTAAQQATTLRASAKTKRDGAAEYRRLAEKEDAEAVKMETEAQQVEEKLSKAEPLPNPKDISELSARVETAQKNNELFKVKQRRDVLIGDLRSLETKAEKLTGAMQNRANERQTAIASAKMPVEGLSFGEGEVLFGELPLSQASDAEQLRISVGIAMAANPKLRVLRIRDGSLLDDKSLVLIRGMADREDYQIWIEQVDTTGKVGIYLEDGQVANQGDEKLAPSTSVPAEDYVMDADLPF